MFLVSITRLVSYIYYLLWGNKESIYSVYTSISYVFLQIRNPLFPETYIYFVSELQNKLSDLCLLLYSFFFVVDSSDYEPCCWLNYLPSLVWLCAMPVLVLRFLECTCYVATVSHGYSSKGPYPCPCHFLDPYVGCGFSMSRLQIDPKHGWKWFCMIIFVSNIFVIREIAFCCIESFLQLQVLGT